MLFEDMAFTCWVMEQEGVLDCRSRSERIESLIQRLIAIGEHCGEINAGHLLLTMEEYHLTDLTPNEKDFILSEVQYRCLIEED
jgi:hypothetical protein